MKKHSGAGLGSVLGTHGASGGGPGRFSKDLGTILDPFWKDFGHLFGEILESKTVPFATSFFGWFSLQNDLKRKGKGNQNLLKRHPKNRSAKRQQKTCIFREVGYRWIVKNNGKPMVFDGF